MSFPVCKFFRSEQGCKFGNKCRYKHSDQSPPAFSASDYQSRYDGPVSEYYPAEAFSPQQGYFAEPEGYHNESSVGNHRYSDNRPLHSYPTRPRGNNEDFVRARSSQAPRTAGYLEEKFQELTASDHNEGAVRSGAYSSSQPVPQRKLCHFFARNGNCCFGSRCRFEHARPREIPPRFQQDGSDSRHRGQPSLLSDGKREEQEENKGVRYSRGPHDGRNFTASLSRTGSASAGFDTGNRANQNPKFGPGQERTEDGNDGGNQMTQSTKPDKVCQFFVRGRCWKGKRCRFLHPRQPEATPAKEVDPETKHDEQEEKSTVPPDEQKEGSASTRNQSASAQSHTEPSPKLSQKPRTTYVAQGTRKYRRDEVDDVEGSRLRRTEIEQLVKRFPKSKVKVNRDCAEFFQCIVSFSPTDPDWPFDVKVFQLEVEIPSDYPFEMMTITLPTEQDLPETVRRYLEVSIEEWLDDKERQLADSGQVELVFRPFLRWLDRNIEDVVTEGLKQMKRELVAKAAGLEFVSAKELQKQYPGKSSSSRDNEASDDDSNDDNDSDDDETDSQSQDEEEEGSSSDYEGSDRGDVSDEKAEEDQIQKKGRKSVEDKVKAMIAEPDRRGTEMSLKNLQLKESAATLYLEKICLMVQCERCKATAEFMASPGRLNMIQCGQCSQTQTATYRPAMAHHFSAVIGYLDLDACLPYDLILQNCNAVVACLNCSKDTKTGAVMAGQPQDKWCRVCHHKLRVATDGMRFTQLEPSAKPPQSLKGTVKVVMPSRKRIPKDPAIQEGKPLPNFGTCRHYKKSYRWLRFPCCGKCYPCDVCHDNKEDHEMVFANRMVCGFCCKEQPFAPERPCKGCDMNMTRVHTKHWEGGQGCRDKISMSRNDKQKHRNMSKTVSKHSQKVKEMQSKKRTKLRHS